MGRRYMVELNWSWFFAKHEGKKCQIASGPQTRSLCLPYVCSMEPVTGLTVRLKGAKSRAENHGLELFWTADSCLKLTRWDFVYTAENASCASRTRLWMQGHSLPDTRRLPSSNPCSNPCLIFIGWMGRSSSWPNPQYRFVSWSKICHRPCATREQVNLRLSQRFSCLWFF